MSEDHAMQGAEDRVRMTYEDLLALPDDGMRHELIDGEAAAAGIVADAATLSSGDFGDPRFKFVTRT